MTAADPQHPDDLVVLLTKPTEFEANLVVMTLRDAGIEAFAFPDAANMLEFGAAAIPVPVQVRQEDFERARGVLEQAAADSATVDWEQVDVGARDDSLPLTVRHGLPLMVKVGFALAVAALLVGIIAAVAIILGLL